MKIPSYYKCLAIHTGQLLMWLLAFWMVPLGFLFGGIRQGPSRFGQWSWQAKQGEVYKGVPIPFCTVQSIDCRGIWKWFDIPDEPGIGLYEPTVAAIYNKFGWWVTVYYQLAFRNVGHGFLYQFAQRDGSPSIALRKDLLLKSPIGSGGYGLRPYEDWRSYTEGGMRDPSLPRAYYYVPALNETMDW